MLGHEDIATRLVFAGADVNFQDPRNKTGVLHKAVREGRTQLANCLLMGGADPNSRDGDGSTPLHIAATEGLGDLVCDLLLKGADKDARDTLDDSPLILAAQHGHLSVANTLLASGANCSLRVWGSAYSALDRAAEKGHVYILQAILDHGADVNSSNRYGETALHVAARSDQEGAVHALIEAGADIESKNGTEQTPLTMAASYNRRKAMLALLQRGANVNARNEDEWTPLHFLCFEPALGVQASVDLLLRWGADETALDTADQTIPDMLEASTYRTASEGEIENVRVLLARAPVDRAWRRRGWLVMLRSRASKARTIGYGVGGGSDGKSGGRSNGTGDGEVEDHKVARRENAGGANHTASEESCSGDGGAEGGVSNLSGVVALLFGLATEGVFRTVVGYL